MVSYVQLMRGVDLAAPADRGMWKDDPEKNGPARLLAMSARTLQLAHITGLQPLKFSQTMMYSESRAVR